MEFLVSNQFTKTTFYWLDSLCPPGVLRKTLKERMIHILEWRTEQKKRFFLEKGRTKSAGGVLYLFPSGVPINLYKELIWKEFQIILISRGIWMESRGKKEYAFRGLIHFGFMDKPQNP